MDYKIRELKQKEIGVLNTFLYEAIFIPDGVDAPTHSTLLKKNKQLQIIEKSMVWSFIF